MPEFTEVMKQWRRMCDNHACSRNALAFPELPICPLATEHDGFPCDEDPIYWTEEATKQLEEIVMAWAAEHTEIYPTWWEWLASIGAVTRKVKPDVASELIETGLLDIIPTDFAQEHGIKPKE